MKTTFRLVKYYLLLAILQLSIGNSLFSLGEIQYPGFHQLPENQVNQPETNKLILRGLLSLRNPASKLLPSLAGKVNPDYIGFIYDNFTTAMILNAGGYQKEAEDILDYFTTKMKAPSKSLEYYSDCNGIFGIIKLIKSKDNQKNLKSIVNAVVVDSSSSSGTGGFEYYTTPGPLHSSYSRCFM